MGTENMFVNLKNVYELAFENFKMLTEQQKNIFEVMLKNSKVPNSDYMMSVYNEWVTSTEKGLDMFKDVVLKGLDNLNEVFTKNMKA